jgi:pilus assembly protein Flp/PilA
VKNLLKRFVREEKGQDLIEYAFLAAFISLATIVGISALGTALDTKYADIGPIVAGAGS